jgi:hypothetical protein
MRKCFKGFYRAILWQQETKTIHWRSRKLYAKRWQIAAPPPLIDFSLAFPASFHKKFGSSTVFTQ